MVITVQRSHRWWNNIHFLLSCLVSDSIFSHSPDSLT